MNVADVSHYFVITVHTKLGGTRIEFIKWDGMSFEHRVKWGWYFRYRAALLQVKYPKYRVDTSWGHEQATGRALTHSLANKLRSKKGKVTEYKNKIARFKGQWFELFPIEDYPPYQKALVKYEKLVEELKELETQFDIAK